jgi:hypothetical protein
MTAEAVEVGATHNRPLVKAQVWGFWPKGRKRGAEKETSLISNQSTHPDSRTPQMISC